MRTRLLLALGSLALPLSATTAAADQSAAPLHLASIISPRPTPDSARIHTVLSRADDATAAGRMSEARRMYKGLIDEQRDANQYAGTALWKLASNLVYDGDPAMELNATFEGAILWQKAKRHDLAMAHLERVRCLLQSPAIAEDVKDSIQRRIVG